MAQPSVAREPSMEEILASIRRIIESNEPVAEGAARQSFSDYGDDADMADEAGELDFVPEMAANDPGSPVRDLPSQKPAYPNPHLTAASAAPMAATPAPERSLSLADVAARVRAASGRTAEPLDVAPQQAAVHDFSEQPAPRRPLPPIPELGVPELGAEAEKQSFARPAIAQQAEPVATERPADAKTEAAMETVTSEPRSRPAEEAQPASLPAKIEAAANLMSAEAGAQVARSFGQLADMFDGIENQSLEEMAQDMLRPMLQEWLDDNLPTLVERLVREEIERVARGPRR